MEPQKKDTSNFFRAQTDNHEYWENYLAVRPEYSEEFYDRVLQYHQAHQDSITLEYSVAHDVGTGPGNVAAVLSKHFDKVVASDLNETHLNVAARRLQAISDKTPHNGAANGLPYKALGSNIVFDHVAAETIHKKYPARSASFVAAAECLALLDAEKALLSWASILHPGGTLAAWFYGRPHFVEADGYDANACQEIYNRIADAAFAKVIKLGGPEHKKGWKRGTDCMTSFLDNVYISSDHWTDVERWKWNSDWPMSFYSQAACDFPIDIDDYVQPHEKIEELEDRSFWGESWGIDDWKLFLKMNLPVFLESEEDSHIEQEWRELEQTMGKEGVQRPMGWPVVALLATRK